VHTEWENLLGLQSASEFSDTWAERNDGEDRQGLPDVSR